MLFQSVSSILISSLTAAIFGNSNVFYLVLGWYDKHATRWGPRAVIAGDMHKQVNIRCEDAVPERDRTGEHDLYLSSLTLTSYPHVP